MQLLINLNSLDNTNRLQKHNLTTDAITTSNTIPAESSQIQAINFLNFRGEICGETHATCEEIYGKREREREPMVRREHGEIWREVRGRTRV